MKGYVIMNLDKYVNGEYDAQITELINEKEIDMVEGMQWIKRCQVRGNRTAEAVHTALSMMQAVFFTKDEEVQKAFHAATVQDNVAQVGISTLASTPMIPRNKDLKKLADTFVKKAKEFQATKKLVIFPYIWPVAFGDSIVMLQYMMLEKLKGCTVLAICPTNRDDLRELFETCTWLDGVIDITLMEEEKNRQISLTLKHPTGFLNVAIQEYIITRMLRALPKAAIFKYRYLPYLFGMENNPKIQTGLRIWEERARLYLLGITLPKIVPTPAAEPLKKITVHFREGKYGDSEGRDINPNYSQDLIDALAKEYPDYEIVRLGDSSMTFLNNCYNASHADLSVRAQMEQIQQSELFIGCHSAPQMLAVACSDTPIICINYTAQETTTDMETENIAKLSYEPISKQVKKIFYVKMLGKDGVELIPTQNNPQRVRVEYEPIENIMKEVKEVLNHG